MIMMMIIGMMMITMGNIRIKILKNLRTED